VLVGEVATRVQQHAVTLVDDGKLVGLDAFTLYQFGKGDALVITIIIKHQSHDCSLRENCRQNVVRRRQIC
jgi:hypothetical protein